MDEMRKVQICEEDGSMTVIDEGDGDGLRIAFYERAADADATCEIHLGKRDADLIASAIVYVARLR